MELQQYLTMLRDRWVLALITALLVLAAVAGFTFLQTPQYQATNRVFVQTQAGSSVADLNSGVNFASQQITSYADVATSPLVLDPVIEELDLDMSTQALAAQISTTVPPETLILELTATDDDPAQAAAIANATSESLRVQVSALEATEGEATVALTVISPAVEPTSPASPSILRNGVIGLALAALAGAAVVVVRDLFDNRVRRPEDIEQAFDRAVIAAIPASRDAMNLPLITVQHPQSAQAEAYRELRTNLQFMGLTGDNRSVLFTSALPGEGKTSSAISLAHVVAQAGNRVLLIDADLRRPTIARYLGLEGGAGLTSVLSGRADLDDVTQPLETEGLEVLASGPIPPNPSELLGSMSMQNLLTEAIATYDFVIIDTAPMLAVTDAVALSHYVGGTVVVAESERVRRPQLAQALEKLDVVEARLLGVVLNRVRGGSRSFYSYDYSPTSEGALPSSRPAPNASKQEETEPAPGSSDESRDSMRPRELPSRTRDDRNVDSRRGRRAAPPSDLTAATTPGTPDADQNHRSQ